MKRTVSAQSTQPLPLRLRICTWNVGNAEPTTLHPWIPTCSDFDLLVVGVQESTFSAHTATGNSTSPTRSRSGSTIAKPGPPPDDEEDDDLSCSPHIEAAAAFLAERSPARLARDTADVPAAVDARGPSPTGAPHEAHSSTARRNHALLAGATAFLTSLVAKQQQRDNITTSSSGAAAMPTGADPPKAALRQGGGVLNRLFEGSKVRPPTYSSSALFSLVKSHLGSEWKEVRTLVMWQIGISVFVRKSIAHLITAVDSDCQATGLFGITPNKGAVAVTLQIGGDSFVFVSAHLAAHIQHAARRNLNAVDIVNGIRFGRWHIDVDHQYDHVIFCGDLNYRIDPALTTENGQASLAGASSTPHITSGASSSMGTTSPSLSSSNKPMPSGTSSAIVVDQQQQQQLSSWSAREPSTSNASSISVQQSSIPPQPSNNALTGDSPGEKQRHDAAWKQEIVLKNVEEGNWNQLIKMDQLRNAQENGHAFVGFCEADISFAPTFKVGRSSGTVYSAQRVPSWCDRVLFKSRSTLADRLRCTSYTSFEGISTSDHKPVAATFEVAIRTHAVPPSRPIKGAELPVFKLHSLLGDDLAPMDINGLSDPYVMLFSYPSSLIMSRAIPSSSVKPRTLHPSWSEKDLPAVQLIASTPEDLRLSEIMIVVMDEDASADDRMGQVSLPLAKAASTPGIHTFELPVTKNTARRGTLRGSYEIVWPAHSRRHRRSSGGPPSSASTAAGDNAMSHRNALFTHSGPGAAAGSGGPSVQVEVDRVHLTSCCGSWRR